MSARWKKALCVALLWILICSFIHRSNKKVPPENGNRICTLEAWALALGGGGWTFSRTLNNQQKLQIRHIIAPFLLQWNLSALQLTIKTNAFIQVNAVHTCTPVLAWRWLTLVEIYFTKWPSKPCSIYKENNVIRIPFPRIHSLAN